MASCKLVIGNYEGLYLACIIQTYGCPLLYGAFLATKIWGSMARENLPERGVQLVDKIKEYSTPLKWYSKNAG